jgi:cytochrome c oxidase subunit 4
MSHASEAGHGADHVPHVLPLATYLKVFAALLSLTALTVAVSYVNVGAWNIVIALGVATTKATLVAAVFMHLWYDHKFNALVLGSAVLFLTIMLALTLADTSTRGSADSIEGRRPRDYTAPFVEGKPDLRGAPLPPPNGEATKPADGR